MSGSSTYSLNTLRTEGSGAKQAEQEADNQYPVAAFDTMQYPMAVLDDTNCRHKYEHIL